MSSMTGNLCNKCPKQPVKQNSSYNDYFNAISVLTSNSRAPGGPVTFCQSRALLFDALQVISYTDVCEEMTRTRMMME